MNKSNSLTGKVALVTGASKGIGTAIAKRLAADGASVAVNYASSREGAERVVKEIQEAGGTAFAVQADLSKKSEIDSMFADTLKTYGRLDILVNNAGVYDFVPLENITEEHFHRLFNINVLGLIQATQVAAASFGEEGGSVINIGSIAGTSAVPAAAVYCGTKAAVNAVTRCLAAELGAKKIRVNAVNPGMVETEGVRSSGIAESDFRKVVESQTPLGRIGQPEDIAPLVSFLASSDSSWITGETYHVSGGYH